MNAKVESIVLPPITAKTSRELLVELLRDGILSGRYSPGGVLLHERDLVAQTGLSRGSVREALRILEAEGLIATRLGRNGGSVVARPSPDLFKRQIYTYVHAHQLSLSQMIETREALEPDLAQLAARNRSSDDIQSLKKCQQAMEDAAGHDVKAFIAGNAAWHLAVATASRNDILRLFMEPVSEMVANAMEITPFEDLAVQKAILRAHETIMNAIISGDEEAAHRRMLRHARGYPEQ